MKSGNHSTSVNHALELTLTHGSVVADTALSNSRCRYAGSGAWFACGFGRGVGTVGDRPLAATFPVLGSVLGQRIARRSEGMLADADSTHGVRPPGERRVFHVSQVDGDVDE
jgi:hypothetical protein